MHEEDIETNSTGLKNPVQRNCSHSFYLKRYKKKRNFQ